jgi:hypothetical protein
VGWEAAERTIGHGRPEWVAVKRQEEVVDLEMMTQAVFFKMKRFGWSDKHKEEHEYRPKF